MHKTLNLREQVLALGRQHLESGRHRRALDLLGKLAAFGELPEPVAEETQSHLARIHFRQRNYRQARRHLTAALTRRPEEASYHHLLGKAWADDEDGDLRKALHHFRRAVELDGDKAEYRCDYGLCLVALRRHTAGLRHLAAAVEREPRNIDYLRHLAFHLVEAGKGSAARARVLDALFRTPRDPKLRLLWNEVRFREARQQQLESRSNASSAGSALPRLLRFPDVQTSACEKSPGTEETLRLDPPSRLPRPHFPKALKRHHRP